MKCSSCNSEWQLPRNAQSMFCPFCHAPLIKVKKEFKDLDEALSYLVSEFGTDILRNKQNVMQFLEEFFQEGKREYNFVSNLYASGLMDTLFRLQNVPGTIQKTAVKQLEKQLCEKYGASKDWSEYVVGCVCKALEVANNVDESSIGLRQSAERGDPAAQVTLAKRYHSGQGIKRDQEQYIYWLKKAAESDYAEAQFLLGMELYNGRVCDKDINSALKYLDQAAHGHSIDAMCFILADTELQRLCKLNLMETLRYLCERKNALSSEQLIQLSKYYEQTDLAQALELVRLSYNKDQKNAWQYYVKLLKKSGTHESDAMALKVTKDIAAEGNVAACLSLAHRYEDQAKTENDMLTALYWYRMAAEVGELDAQLRLARIYEKGKLVKKDLESAVYWYRVAAYNGSQYAKDKVSYKSPECIIHTLTLIFEDDIELEYRVLSVVNHQGTDYLLIEDPDTKEPIPVKYTEIDTIEGFEIEQVDEKTEKIVLHKLGGASR